MKNPLARMIGPKSLWLPSVNYHRKYSPGYICFCLPNDGRLQWCIEDPTRRQCIHKHNEVTHLFNQWFDGKIDKRALVKALRERSIT